MIKNTTHKILILLFAIKCDKKITNVTNGDLPMELLEKPTYLPVSAVEL